MGRIWGRIRGCLLVGIRGGVVLSWGGRRVVGTVWPGLPRRDSHVQMVLYSRRKPFFIAPMRGIYLGTYPTLKR